MIPSSAPWRSSPISKRGEELLLGFGGAREHALEQLQAPPLGAAAGLGGMFEGAVDIVRFRVGLAAGELRASRSAA